MIVLPLLPQCLDCSHVPPCDFMWGIKPNAVHVRQALFQLSYPQHPQWGIFMEANAVCISYQFWVCLTVEKSKGTKPNLGRGWTFEWVFQWRSMNEVSTADRCRVASGWVVNPFLSYSLPLELEWWMGQLGQNGISRHARSPRWTSVQFPGRNPHICPQQHPQKTHHCHLRWDASLSCLVPQVSFSSEDKLSPPAAVTDSGGGFTEDTWGLILFSLSINRQNAKKFGIRFQFCSFESGWDLSASPLACPGMLQISHRPWLW